MASWERPRHPLEPWGVRQLPLERAHLWLVDLLWGFSPHFEILRVPVKGSKGYARCRQQACAMCLGLYVFACLHAGVCVCVTPPSSSAVTDARLFICEAQEGQAGRWDACVKASVWTPLCPALSGLSRRACQSVQTCIRTYLHTQAYAHMCPYLGEETQN